MLQPLLERCLNWYIKLDFVTTVQYMSLVIDCHTHT